MVHTANSTESFSVVDITPESENSWSRKQSIMCILQNKLSELAKSNAFNKLTEESLP
jgi:hypothetical protein